LLRSAVWLLIYWTKYYISEFVIVPKTRSNCASEYTPGLVQQVSIRRLLLLVKAKFGYAIQLASWFASWSAIS